MIGLCRNLGREVPWSATQASGCQIRLEQSLVGQRFRTVQEVLLQNGEWCNTKAKSWVIYQETAGDPPERISKLGRVLEVLQIIGSAAEVSGRANGVLIQSSRLGALHEEYRMPHADLSASYKLLPVSVSHFAHSDYYPTLTNYIGDSLCSKRSTRLCWW